MSDGMPQANSTASMPRRTSARASLERLAVLARDGERDRFAALLEPIGVAEKQPRSLDHRNGRPRIVGFVARAHDAIEVGALRDRNVAERFAGRFVAHFESYHALNPPRASSSASNAMSSSSSVTISGGATIATLYRPST